MNIVNTHSLAFPAIIDGLNCAQLTRDQFIRTLNGGVKAINVTATMPGADLETSMAALARLLAITAENSDLARIVKSASEIEEASRDGALALIIGTQDASFMQHNIELLRVLHALGMRIMQPVYNEENRFGHGALANPKGGLSELGHNWVALMNELNMQIDLSHCGYETARQVLAASKQPVIFSHSNARALCDSPRNIPDDLAHKAAESGGTVGITLWPPLLGIKEQPTLENFCDQVDYMVNLIGVDHVAFGSDLSEGTRTEEQWLAVYGENPIWPRVTGILGDWFTFHQRTTPGFESMAKAQNLNHALEKRGYTSGKIEKIMCTNLLRVYREVWGA